VSAATHTSAAVEPVSAVRIVNRSEFWSCTVLMVTSQLAGLLGGLGTLYLVAEILDLDPGLGLACAGMVAALGFLIAFLPFPDTTDWIRLGTHVELKRIHRRRKFPFDRVIGVEFARPAGEDYDEKQHALRFSEVTIRLRRVWPVWLLVTLSDAETVGAWAAAHGIPVIDRRA
jgi:hypothetical protein